MAAKKKPILILWRRASKILSKFNLKNFHKDVKDRSSALFVSKAGIIGYLLLEAFENVAFAGFRRLSSRFQHRCRSR